MISVYQAEWCPYSSKVRMKLTELGLPFVAMPVPVERGDREEMRAAVGTDEIPAVVLDDGTILTGDTDEILRELADRFPEPPGAEAHRRKAIEEASHR